MVGLTTPTGRVHFAEWGWWSRATTRRNSWRGRFIFLKRTRLMAYHERRNSKVAKLRSCNRGFHNVGFDFSAFLPHKLPLPSPVSLFQSFFQFFFPPSNQKNMLNKRGFCSDVLRSFLSNTAKTIFFFCQM